MDQIPESWGRSSSTPNQILFGIQCLGPWEGGNWFLFYFLSLLLHPLATLVGCHWAITTPGPASFSSYSPPPPPPPPPSLPPSHLPSFSPLTIPLPAPPSWPAPAPGPGPYPPGVGGKTSSSRHWPRHGPGPQVREAIQQKIFAFLWYSSKGGGGSRPIQKFWVTFFCPVPIKSKQMPMCQKAKNSEKGFFEFFFKEFWKKWLKSSKSRGGGSGNLGKIP